MMSTHQNTQTILAETDSSIFPWATKMDHVGIFVSDLKVARKYYENILGLKFVEQGEDDSVWMMTLRATDKEIHLFQSKTPGTKPHINHIAFQVAAERFEAVMKDLRRRGIAFSGPHQYQNTDFIKFKDGDGLTWEFIRVRS